MFEIEYEFREQDLLHFNELRLENDQEMQKNIRKNRLFVPGIMLFIGLFYYVYYVDMLTTAYITILALVWGIVSPYIMKMDMRRQIINNYSEAEKKAMFGIHKLTIDQDYLIETSPGGTSKTPWSEMLRVDSLKEYVHIFIAIDAAIVIPKETVKSGDLKKFAKQAESMIERLG
ncbi:YcxB family protein [Methylomarinum sp. Ch1-1]|uniref:YcxB family protein n=1 Tax=Methylomarinum roseum TaxID=3067653 RepID=A0AAU7NX02_9GAMM|nr:YcxB family protein [Methylomarinum sp. Ch1-1]MDP4522446.1 YcxB family protein [Methylomarinum sp. Ch1-1]